MQKQFQDLLKKEMSRKEFLKSVGVGVASIVGVATFVQLINNKPSLPAKTTGYGSSPYGK